MSSMQIQVNLKTADKSAELSTVQVHVKPTDTIESIKEKIAVSQFIAFPEHSLQLNGKALDAAQTISACGVTAASVLDFVLEATEESLVKQLKELLQSRDLTSDELGLLYCYKHGVSTNQALKTIGVNLKLVEFVTNRKDFQLDNGKIAVVRTDTILKPLCVADELESVLRKQKPTMDIHELVGKFTERFHVSVANIVQMRPIDYIAKEERFAIIGTNLVTLKEWEARERALHTQASRAPRTPPQPRTPSQPRARVERSKSPAYTPPSRVRAASPQVTPPPRDASPGKEARRGKMTDRRDLGESDELYQELLQKITTNGAGKNLLTKIQDIVIEKSFIDVKEVVKSGSYGKGTQIADGDEAELVFFLNLPCETTSKWLPSLLKLVQSTLTMNWSSDEEADITSTDEAVVVTANSFTVYLRFSSVFESYTDAIQTLGQLGPQARKSFEPTFAKERTDFVAKQPGHVKATIRLLKWWRDQQTWSCSLTRPVDYILELVAIYASQQCGKVTQTQMIANCMSLLSHFDSLRVVWSNFYDPKDVWGPLMKQAPLLMDPVNPFSNVADPQEFDARELMACAANTHFFW